MAKTEWVVRVLQFSSGDPRHPSRFDRDCLPGLWLEQLDRAGLIERHINEEMIPNAAILTPIPEGRDEPEHVFKNLFDIRAPKGQADTKAWAQRNAERMQSFGINAEAAPAWVGTNAAARSYDSVKASMIKLNERATQRLI